MNQFLKNQPELFKLSELILKGDLSLVQSAIQSGTPINSVFEIPTDVDLSQYVESGPQVPLIDRLFDSIPAAIWDLATGKKKSKAPTSTTTLLSVYIATDNLAAVESSLSLGADPKVRSTWHFDAFEMTIQLRKAEALDLLLKHHPFGTLPQGRQQSLVLALPRQNTSGNFLTGYRCELDKRLLEVGLQNGIDFDLPILKENAVKIKSTSSLMEESLQDPNGALVMEWLLQNNFGKTTSKEKILSGLEQFRTHFCANQNQIIERIQNLLKNR